LHFLKAVNFILIFRNVFRVTARQDYY